VFSWGHSERKTPSNRRSQRVLWNMIIAFVPIVAAAGYSLIYLLLGGGLGGAVLIFIVAKMLGK
jgi:hypothetical protein